MPDDAGPKSPKPSKIGAKCRWLGFQNDFQIILLTETRLMRENENRPVAAPIRPQLDVTRRPTFPCKRSPIPQAGPILLRYCKA